MGKIEVQSNFSVYHFEAICTGLQNNIDRIDPENEEHIRKTRITLMEIKTDKDFIAVTTGGGKNSPGPLRRRIQIVNDKLSEIQL